MLRGVLIFTHKVQLGRSHTLHETVLTPSLRTHLCVRTVDKWGPRSSYQTLQTQSCFWDSLISNQTWESRPDAPVRVHSDWLLYWLHIIFNTNTPSYSRHSDETSHFYSTSHTIISFPVISNREACFQNITHCQTDERLQETSRKYEITRTLSRLQNTGHVLELLICDPGVLSRWVYL